MPVIPSKVTETVQTVHNVAVSNISAAVEKVDNFATGGIDQLTEKVPQLKETTPKLIENTKVNIEKTKTSVTSYFTAVTEYAASFSVAQVALKAVDASLEMVDGVLNKIGSDEKGTVRIGFRTDSVYEDEHAKVITNKSETDDPEPVIVDTDNLNKLCIFVPDCNENLYLNSYTCTQVLK